MYFTGQLVLHLCLLGSLLALTDWLPGAKCLNSHVVSCNIGLLFRQSPRLDRLAAKERMLSLDGGRSLTFLQNHGGLFEMHSLVGHRVSRQKHTHFGSFFFFRAASLFTPLLCMGACLTGSVFYPVWGIVLASGCLGILTGGGDSLLATHPFRGVNFLSLFTVSSTAAVMLYKNKACCVEKALILFCYV